MRLMVLVSGAVLLSSPVQAEEPRFSGEARTLLEQITQGYDLDGKRMPAGKVEDKVIAELAKSTDPRVREIAQHMPELKLLSALNKQSGQKVAEVYGKAAENMIKSISARLLTNAVKPEEERETVNGAILVLESMLAKPQEAVNQAWAIAYTGNDLGNSLKAKLSELARSGRPKEPENRTLVEISLGTEARLGTVTVTNPGKKPLHHCLIITRLEAQADRLAALAKEEDSVGQFILPALGFSQKTVRASRLAAELRYKFYQQDKGVVVYVPEIPAGGTVTTTLANPAYYRIGKGADVSIWCDEGYAEHVPAKNWESVWKSATAKPSQKKK